MPTSVVKRLNVLVLGHPTLSDDLAGWLDANARVQTVDTFDAVLQTLQSEPFDLILSAAADFVPFTQHHFNEQAANILDNVSQAVCIVGRTGEIIWANPKLWSLPESVRKELTHYCVETFNMPPAETPVSAAHYRGRRLSISGQGNDHYEVTVSPITDMQNQITQVVAVVWDTTRARKLEEKLDAIDRAGSELVRLDAEQVARLDLPQRVELLEQKIIRYTRELLHFDHFTIRVLDLRTNRLNLVLSCGMPKKAQDLELYASREGNGITGYVAASGRSCICPDVTHDPRYLEGIDGARSSLTVPLWLNDRVVGVANFESTKPAAFNEEDRQFAEIFGRYVALALHVLELLITERHATAGQVSSNVMSEITAPLNDILTEIESLVEDYIGYDDLRHRLRAISDNAVKIRESIKQVTSAKSVLTGGRSGTTRCEDPTLKGKRILVVDDEDVIRETVRDVLSGLGCEVTTAVNGEEAVELIAHQSFDLVLSDIKMPGKTGYDVFAAAKDANVNTHVILMTGFGYDPNHSLVRARREGLTAVLFKPFKIEQLLSEVRTAARTTPSAGAARGGPC